MTDEHTPPTNERKRGSGVKFVYDVLRDEILDLVLAPGSQIDEIQLAERLSMSRTPIREALNLLLGEGLVESRPRRGAVVTQVTPHRLIEMFEVMAELEAMCARLATRRISDEEFATLEAAHLACREAAQANNPDDYFYANERFHYALYTAAHSAFLFDQAASLQRKLRPYRRLQLRVRNRVQKSFEEHESILEALRAGDAELAMAHVRTHVVVQGERFADLVACLGQMSTQGVSPEGLGQKA